jgi:hypothetical protein
MDANWAKEAAKYEEAYQQAESFDDWEPKANCDLNCVVDHVRSGNMKSGHPYLAVKVRIVSGQDPESGADYTDRAFQPWFFGIDPDRPAGMGELKKVAGILSGSQVTSLAAAGNLLEAATGTVLTLRGKERNYTDRNGNDRTATSWNIEAVDSRSKALDALVGEAEEASAAS